MVRIKITALLFVMLFAAGWNNMATAQALPESAVSRYAFKNVGASNGTPANAVRSKKMLKAPLRADNEKMKSLTAAEADLLTYKWWSAEKNDSVTSKATDVATKAEQMYELLRFVYMNPAFPGPFYSAYTSDGVREDPVYYGAVAGGWNIPDKARKPVGDIVIKAQNGYVGIKSIYVYNESGSPLTQWVGTSNGTSVPSGWTFDTNSNEETCHFASNGDGSYYMTYGSYGGGILTISSGVLGNATYVRIVINGALDSGTSDYTLTVNGESKTLTNTFTDYAWESGSVSSKTFQTVGDITINANTYSRIGQIVVKSGSENITGWNINSSSLPAGWQFDSNPSYASNGYMYFDDDQTLTIKGYLFDGLYESVEVEILAYDSSSRYYGTLSVNGESQQVAAEDELETHTWTVSKTVQIPLNNPYAYKPNVEGYTGLMVALKDTLQTAPRAFAENDATNFHNYFNSKSDIIDYLANNVSYIKLMTDGMRIGKDRNGNDTEETGTVFNIDGTYNRFFMLGKGQARKKDDAVLVRQQRFGYELGERVPFKNMFEQFSPTGGMLGDDITDFYSEMMEGHTYDVVHDCASVIENAHEFSMSGHTGTTHYAMSGLNFFIPDYRLKYWETGDTIKYTNGSMDTYTVDGRTLNPYKDNTGASYSRASNFVANYGNYIKQNPPKVGIYRITLEASAEPVSGYSEPDNRYYDVNLDWSSSLNEMSGHDVPQTYIIYEVVYDENGNEDYEYIATVQNVTEYHFPEPFEQQSYSVPHTYIIKGSPTDNDHPSFIAWSNQDQVIIPGYKDFLALGLDHYESDFVINQEKNYYRNFLTVSNDNDMNALTTSRINAGERVFNLYRYDFYKPETSVKKVATLTFDPVGTNAKSVHYSVDYVTNNQEIRNYNLPKINKTNVYRREIMGIPDTGSLSVKGNGDIVIQPNGLNVNFKSIIVQSGNTTITRWPVTGSTQTQANTLPRTWRLSPGCKWEQYGEGYYLEGGGYIVIPASLLSNYSNLTVTINAYGDGSSISKVLVNDISKTIANTNPKDYVWERVETTSTVSYTNTEVDHLDFVTNFTPGGEDTDAGTTIVLSSPWSSNYFYLFGDYAYIAYTNDTNNGNLTFTIPQGYSNETFVVKIGVPNSDYGNGYFTFNGEQVNCTAGAICTWEKSGLSSGNQIVIKGSVNYNGVQQGYSPDMANVYVYVKRQGGTSNAGMVRLGNLPIVDQFAADVSANDHPRRYGYVLRYEPNNSDAQESGRVVVPVQHTESVVNGYLTESQLVTDSLTHGMPTDVLTADVQFNLSKTNTAVFYNTIQGKVDSIPADYRHYLTVLQRRSDGKFEEMKSPSPLNGKKYKPGEHHYFDSVPTNVGSYKTYVPSVMTMGQNRRYYEVDSLHNTYGAPIWKTGKGEVQLASVTAERQKGLSGSTNWTDGNDPCSLYILDGLQADGYLPSKTVSNVEYVPYMFRVFVESKNGKLRGYREVPAGEDENLPGSHLDGDPNGTHTGPLCVWSEYISNSNNVTFPEPGRATFSKNKDSNDWSNNIMFGALDEIIKGTDNNNLSNIDPDDLTIYVRYYFKAVGKESTAVDPEPEEPGSKKLRDGDGTEDEPEEIPMFSATERSKTPSPWTAVAELSYMHEVVGVIYVNPQGLQSDKPFDGINIVITRYSDGSTSTAKIVR